MNQAPEGAPGGSSPPGSSEDSGSAQALHERPADSEIPAYAVDEQTGKSFAVRPEAKQDTLAARVSAVYLLGVIVLFSWLLFDTWIRAFTIPSLLGYDTARLDSPLFRLLAYAALGGGLGGALTGLRSVLQWHAEKAAYGRRYVWKAVGLPLQGGVLAVLVYVLLRTGIGALNGDFTLQDNELATLSALGLGGLIGYGSHKVFVWLDAQVNRMFHVGFSAVVPNLAGKDLRQGVRLLENVSLSLGPVTEEEAKEPPGTVVRQSPAAGSRVSSPIEVQVVVSKAQPEDGGGDAVATGGQETNDAGPVAGET